MMKSSSFLKTMKDLKTWKEASRNINQRKKRFLKKLDTRRKMGSKKLKVLQEVLEEVGHKQEDGVKKIEVLEEVGH